MPHHHLQTQQQMRKEVKLSFALILIILIVMGVAMYQQKETFSDQIEVESTQKRSSQGDLRIINDKPEDKDKKAVSVIVTLTSGGSYDQLFTQVEQKVKDGSKVEVYQGHSSYIDDLISVFEGKPKDDVAIRMMKSINSVQPDCVVFNWECSSGYSGQQFPQGKEKVFFLLKKVIERGHMAMFSDFSLKALINTWDQKYDLGPNPFINFSSFTGKFNLRFDPQELKSCPSTQLQTVGELARQNTCRISAMGGTIVYTVNNRNLNHNSYKLQVLSVVQELKPNQENLACKIGEYEGAAGHVLLTYPSGGTILTSMGHWIQLMKIDTSAEKLFDYVERQYGTLQAGNMRKKYAEMNEEEQQQYIIGNSNEMVQSVSPGGNMLNRGKKVKNE